MEHTMTKNLGAVEFDTALSKVGEALKAQGFGVITEIDVKATMKNKLNVDFRNYKILGACNPPIAHQALSQDVNIGLLLPCNVIVYENDDHGVVVSIASPKDIFKLVDKPEMQPMADEITSKLQNAIDAL